MPGKKENNKKNYEAHQTWLESKKQNRSKQVWIWDTNEQGHWEKA